MDSGGTETNEEWAGLWTYSGGEVKAQLQVHLMPTKTSNKRAIQKGCVDLLEGIIFEMYEGVKGESDRGRVQDGEKFGG